MATTAQQDDGAAPTGMRVATIDRGGNMDVGATMERSAFALAPAEDPLLATVRVMAQLHELAKVLVASGFCPRGVNTPEKAMAIMLTGREMGIGPMLAIRAISIVDGKPVVAADLQLSRFKASGGRAQFEQLDDSVAKLHLRHPNGDEHTETWTAEQAQAAGLLAKDNWRKHRVAMMRSRVITAGLKSVGYEATAGVYDPDESDHWQPGASDAIARGEDPNALVRRDFGQLPAAQAAAAQHTDPQPAAAQQDDRTTGSRYESVWLKKDGREGTPLDARDADGVYVLSVLDLDAAGKFAFGKLESGTAKNSDVLRKFCTDCAAEIGRREIEAADHTAEQSSSTASANSSSTTTGGK